MEEKHKPTNRHRDLSLMFLKMGKSLIDEGLKNKDLITATLGNSMIFMSSVVFEIDETRQFGDLCNMMSSRRLVRGVTSGSFNNNELSEFTKFNFDELNKLAKNDPYQEIFNKIKRDLDNLDDDSEKDDNLDDDSEKDD